MTDRRAAYDEEGLPWLEAVADEDGPRAVSGRKMAAALILVGIGIALVVATFFLLGRRETGAAAGPPELIRADSRPYKVRPADPGGLDVARDSESAFATSAGADTDAKIDLNATSEAPIARPDPAPKPTPAAPVEAKLDPAKAKPVPLKPVKTVKADSARSDPLAPAAASGGSGSTVQLGAFSSAAKAEAAWSALSARFSVLSGATKLVVPVSGSSLYRLRASAPTPAEAKSLCQALRVAGESCVVIG